MKDSEVKAYAQAMGVLYRAYRRAGRSIDDSEVADASRHPARGFTRSFIKAVHAQLLTDADHTMISAALDAIDGPLEGGDDEPLGAQQGCNWWVAYYQWQRVMTASQAAEALGVSRQYLTNLKRAGKLDYMSAGGHIYYSRATIEQMRLKREQSEQAGDSGE